MQTKPHEGRNIKRIREIMGIKQETLAIDLGLSQQAISRFGTEGDVGRADLGKGG